MYFLLIFIYFLNYILLIMLSSYPECSFFALSTQSPLLPQAVPSPLFMFMGHAYKCFGYSIVYTVLYIPMAVL